MKPRITQNTLRALSSRRGVFFAASMAAAAASAWEYEHRRVRRADLTETHMRVEKLSDLRYEQQALDTIESGLVEEWGEFAFLGFKDLRDMLNNAGDTIFVVVERDESGVKPRGIVQTILADVHGDPELLRETHPDFATLTSHDSWRRSRNHGGDTAVLLQITTLGPTERGGGLGSLLRNAVLNMLDKRVAYALTTTPVDGSTLAAVNLEDAATYTAAMRFHARGGANPTIALPGYKQPAGDVAQSTHGRDVIMMRYARDEAGEWPSPRPIMRLRSMGPLQLQVARTMRRLKLRRLRSLRTPHPSLRGVARLARRRGKQQPLTPA